jgi:hypothetical protein
MFAKRPQRNDFKHPTRHHISHLQSKKKRTIRTRGQSHHHLILSKRKKKKEEEGKGAYLQACTSAPLAFVLLLPLC